MALWAVQTPDEQKSPVMQSVSAVQVVLQAVAPQMNGVQLVVVAAGQVPVPVQVAAAVATPLAQLAARQAVVAGATAQAPAPLQVPVLPQGGAATQRASASPVTVLAQVPAVPPVLAAEQPMQVPVQAVLQQTPSTQKPEVHCALDVQAVPLAASSRAPAATQPQMAATAALFNCCRSCGMNCMIPASAAVWRAGPNQLSAERFGSPIADCVPLVAETWPTVTNPW